MLDLRAKLQKKQEKSDKVLFFYSFLGYPIDLCNRLFNTIPSPWAPVVPMLLSFLSFFSQILYFFIFCLLGMIESLIFVGRIDTLRNFFAIQG